MRSRRIACSGCLYQCCALTSSGRRARKGTEGKREQTPGVASSRTRDGDADKRAGGGAKNVEVNERGKISAEKLCMLEGESCPTVKTTGLVMACLALSDRWLRLCSKSGHFLFLASPSWTSSLGPPGSALKGRGTNRENTCCSTGIVNIHVVILYFNLSEERPTNWRLRVLLFIET